MGSNAPDAHRDEQPVHRVLISKPFWAGKYEVTVGQILSWLNSTPSWLNSSGVEVVDNWIDFKNPDCPIKKSGSSYALNTKSRFGKSDHQPMVCIDWYGAKAYCAWFSQRLKWVFKARLPTEAEWEYMCRAGSTTKYPWGDSINKHSANYGGHAGDTTTEVGKYSANAFGLFDMLGNVQEWCEDAYDQNFYESKNSTNPNPLSQPKKVSLDHSHRRILNGVLVSSKDCRVVRGGCYSKFSPPVLPSWRSFFQQEHKSNTIGFRIVVEYTRRHNRDHKG